jgi:hypothetical protein
MGLKDLKEMMGKFSFAQMTSNSNGKTSASGTMGVLICTIGSICFLYGSMVKDNDILLQSVVFTGIGAGLLGYRKSQGTGSQIQNQDPNQQLNS